MERLPELDRLVQSAYGDKVMGRVPENLCVQLLNGYEVERAAKQERRKVHFANCCLPGGKKNSP